MDSLKQRMDELAARYNVPEFAASDPVQFPRRYTDKRDIEISAFVTSVISWGRRQMILRNADRIDSIFEGQPRRFVLEGDLDAIGEENLHRTFFGRHLRYLLRGLRDIYAGYDSLEAFAAARGVEKSEAPSWALAEEINAVFDAANKRCDRPLSGPTRCLPADAGNSALKRFNMALRWLVRNDGIVDIGVWDVLKPSQLFIPLDVHSGRTARTLRLLRRTANDRRAAVELTESLRQMNPDDPTLYDFALFGAGVNDGVEE